MYYVVYDLQDNIIAYIDSLEELAEFTNRRKKELKYKFKKRKCIYFKDNISFKKIYAFTD